MDYILSCNKRFDAWYARLNIITLFLFRYLFLCIFPDCEPPFIAIRFMAIVLIGKLGPIIPIWRCYTLHWRHNAHDGVSNHQPHGCLLNRLFTRRSKKTSKLRATGLCVGNSPGPVNSPHKGQLRGKGFHLMTSSWSNSLQRMWRSASKGSIVNQMGLI